MRLISRMTTIMLTIFICVPLESVIVRTLASTELFTSDN